MANTQKISVFRFGVGRQGSVDCINIKELQIPNPQTEETSSINALKFTERKSFSKGNDQYGDPISEENCRGNPIHRVGQDIIEDSLTEEGEIYCHGDSCGAVSRRIPVGSNKENRAEITTSARG